jgi:two-component system cell cycle sensor histidine kinase/response regulator CckA
MPGILRRLAIMEPIRALILGSRTSNAERFAAECARNGIEMTWSCAANEQDYRGLVSQAKDVVLYDDELPWLSVEHALHLLRETGAEVPFVVVASTPDVADAVDAIRQGAADYLPLQRLSARLNEIVTEAARRKQERVQHQQSIARQQSAATVFQNVVEFSLVGIQILQDGKYAYANRKVAALFGYSQEELLALDSWTEVVAPSDREMVLDQVRRRISGETPHAHYVFRGLRKDRTTIDIEIRSDRTEFNGRPAVIGTLIDITERKQAMLALRAAELKFRTLVEQSIVGFYVVQENRMTYVNPRLCEITGYSAEEMKSRPVLDFIADEDRPIVSENIRQRIEGKVQSLRYSLRMKHREGRIVHVEVHGTITEQDGKPAIIGVLMDMTEQRRTEEQLRQSQKMDAVGRLAGGVAHDFNNLLTIINGYSEMIADELPPGTPMRQSVEEILNAGERAANLTRQLLTFSRQQVLMPVTLNLNDRFRDMENMLCRLIGADVDLKFVEARQIWPIRADAGQIEQVMMNLVVNARDAMPHGGKLTVESSNVELDDTYVTMHPDAQPGQYVMLAVSDTGCGIDKPTRQRIFEPFFTTKGDRGTGLGLSTVYGIVREAGGHIEVYSELGLGTCFKVYFPRDLSCESIESTPPEPSALPGGDETILLVEDEDGVRGLARMVLQKRGYRVIEARDGADALRLSEQEPSLIHLMVTDVVMPHMSGRILAERLQALRPEMSVLYMSGYTDDTVVRHGVLDANMHFLQKPFTGAGLSEKVRAVLDARQK